MRSLTTHLPELLLVAPDPERDAPFAHAWFANEADGRETLLLMGNAPHEIEPSTIESEHAIIAEFLELEAEERQITWMIQYQGTTIGAAWIDLVENHDTPAPSVHLMIGDKTMRGRGIGKASLLALVEYIHERTPGATIYSRHLVSNSAVHFLLSSIGFTNDASSYIDENGLEWQQVAYTHPQA